MKLPFKLLGYSDDDFDKLIEAAKSCISNESIAALARVDRVTFWRWLKLGKQEQKARLEGAEPNAALDRCVALYEAMGVGVAELESSALKVVRDAAAAGVYQAACWLLSRRWPSVWGDNRREVVKLLKEIRDLTVGKKGEARPDEEEGPEHFGDQYEEADDEEGGDEQDD